MVFNDCICFQLGAVSRKITRYYKEKLTSMGLTHGQFFVLVALYDEDGSLPSQLADKTALDRPTVTGLLDRLLPPKKTGPTCGGKWTHLEVA